MGARVRAVPNFLGCLDHARTFMAEQDAASAQALRMPELRNSCWLTTRSCTPTVNAKWSCCPSGTSGSWVVNSARRVPDWGRGGLAILMSVNLLATVDAPAAQMAQGKTNSRG